MFDRQNTSELKNSFAAATALLVVAGVLATPALAATSDPLPCKEATEATLHVHVNTLTTEVVSHNLPPATISKKSSLEASVLQKTEVSSSSSLLVPRAEAAIRDVFDDSDELTISSASTKSQPEPITEDDGRQESDIGMNPKLPGISDDDLARYKKQMYRRDI
jgi:hypothetical protein